VAPTVVPDVVILPTDILSSATAENLIFPLNEQLSDIDLESLYPAARMLAQPDAQILGYPLILNDLPHLVYNSNEITGTLPLTWDRLITENDNTLVFAADGNEGAILALQFYLDAGGNLVDGDGQQILQLDPLITALQQLQNGREAGFIVPQSSSLVSIDQSWQAFLGGAGNIVRTNADHFMQQDTGELSLGYTVTAGVDRPLTPLVTGWAYAVSTTDPTKKALATELILELTAASNLGPWSLESRMLPAHSDAFEIWMQEDNAYYNFIGRELQRAQPLPIAANSTTMTVLGDAVFQVVSGAKTAQQAAQDAVNEM
jgi:ABC-type glycerol-3-phosphate transport system substrate-binding protein